MLSKRRMETGNPLRWLRSMGARTAQRAATSTWLFQNMTCNHTWLIAVAFQGVALLGAFSRQGTSDEHVLLHGGRVLGQLLAGRGYNAQAFPVELDPWGVLPHKLDACTDRKSGSKCALHEP